MIKVNKNAKNLFEVIKKFRRITRSDNFLKDMNFNEVMVCGLLMKTEQDNGDAFMQAKDLSEKMKISRPALNNVLNKLEDKGFIERVRKKEDRKAVFIKLTKKSYEIYNQEQERMVSFMNKIVNKLGDEDTVQLINLLEKFYMIMEEEVK